MVASYFFGDLPDPGIESGSPALQADSLPTELRGKPSLWVAILNIHGFFFLSSQTEGIKYLEWPGYSWILGSLKSNVECPYLSHMVGETDFRKHDEILFLSCRDGVETSRRRASCLWGAELAVERTGPDMARRLCREGTRRPGEYCRHHLHGHREPGPRDRWVEASPATHCPLCSLSDGDGRCWT